MAHGQTNKAQRDGPASETQEWFKKKRERSRKLRKQQKASRRRNR